VEENGDQEEEGRETKPKILRDMATLYQTEPCRRTRGGRTKSVVHRYFEKVKMDDGKFKHRCFNCGNFVSPQAQRMRNHLMKCRGKDKSIVSKLLKKTRVPDSNKGTPPKTKMGRTADCVRLLFTETKSPEGYLKMKCNNCGALVSPQADRMKKHLKNRCGEDSKLPPLSKKELEEYEDEDEDSDDSDFSLSSEDESPKRKSSLRSLTSSSATSSQQQNNSTPDDNPSHSSRQVQSTTSNSNTSALNFTGS
jgi:DNA-directed RNA polymerase subunit N (RpoN/RPB10)